MLTAAVGAPDTEAVGVATRDGDGLLDAEAVGVLLLAVDRTAAQWRINGAVPSGSRTSMNLPVPPCTAHSLPTGDSGCSWNRNTFVEKLISRESSRPIAAFA